MFTGACSFSDVSSSSHPRGRTATSKSHRKISSASTPLTPIACRHAMATNVDAIQTDRCPAGHEANNEHNRNNYNNHYNDNPSMPIPATPPNSCD